MKSLQGIRISHPTTKSGICICLALAVAAVTLVAPAATAQTAAPAARQAPKTVELGDLGSHVRVWLNVGDTLRVILNSNPSTGYGWQVANNANPLLQAAGSKNTPAEGKMGASGKQTLTFTAKAAGHDHLLLHYSRAWEKNTPPARSYSLDVTIHNQPPNNQQSGNLQAPVIIPAGTLMGTYFGKLPCADCSGIRTTLSLYATGMQELTNTYYVRTMTYLDAPKGDVTSVEAGAWSWSKGTPADPHASVYSLKSNRSNQLENYRLQGDILVALDSDLKPIQAPFNMNLKKMP
ncbi:MAG TPA: protease inhibitor I42 family protein [Acidobacteriaceae bacterium]|jgi:inhibitor of cysteine peptidase|nr:protease inhibitor I42 family protein [Acidobacteriaceae bacterium]